VPTGIVLDAGALREAFKGVVGEAEVAEDPPVDESGAGDGGSCCEGSGIEATVRG